MVSAENRPPVSTVFVALCILVPQAVLAYRRVGDVAPMTRVRFAAGALLAVVLLTLVPGDGNEVAVAVVAGVLVVGWLAVEAVVAAR